VTAIKAFKRHFHEETEEKSCTTSW